MNTNSLSNQFFSTLISDLDTPDLLGILLGGSYARGDATEYSDVDIACIVADDSQLQRKRFEYRDGRLVSIGTKSIAGIRRDIAKPDAAIWVAPGIGDCRILLDKDGSVAALLEEVRAFLWEPLQEAANSLVSFRLMLAAEMVHKVANELMKGDHLAVSFAVSKLFGALTELVAIGRGVLIKSDNTYYRQVQEAAGPDSAWARYHRIVAGVPEAATVEARGAAALHLYRETVEMLGPVMALEHLAVAEGAVRMVEQVDLLG